MARIVRRVLTRGEKLRVALLGVLVAVFLLKNAVGLLITWYQRTAIARMSVRLTTDLFERYMCQP